MRRPAVLALTVQQLPGPALATAEAYSATSRGVFLRELTLMTEKPKMFPASSGLTLSAWARARRFTSGPTPDRSRSKRGSSR
jgi:hypothetical protein